MFKYEEPKLENLSKTIVLGACAPGSGNSGAGCIAGDMANPSCMAGAENSAATCGDGGADMGPHCGAGDGNTA